MKVKKAQTHQLVLELEGGEAIAPENECIQKIREKKEAGDLVFVSNQPVSQVLFSIQSRLRMCGKYMTTESAAALLLTTQKVVRKKGKNYEVAGGFIIFRSIVDEMIEYQEVNGPGKVLAGNDFFNLIISVIDGHNISLESKKKIIEIIANNEKYFKQEYKNNLDDFFAMLFDVDVKTIRNWRK